MTYLTFTVNSRTYKLSIDEILFIQVAKGKIHRVTIVTADDEFHTYARIKDIEQAYPQFLRCHRDTLVNKEKIRVVDWKERLLYVGDEKRPVHYARSKTNQIKALMANE